MADSTKKPIPLRAVPLRAVCPICRQPSYSAGGIHPQCMLRHNVQVAKQQAAEAAAAVAAKSG